MHLELTAPVLGEPSDVVGALRARRIVKFDATKLMERAPFGWGLSDWQERHGEAIVNRRVYKAGYAEKLARHLAQYEDDTQIDVRELPRARAHEMFERQPVQLAELIQTVLQFSDYRPDSSFANLRVSLKRYRESCERIAAYGVMNARSLQMDWHLHSVYRHWKRTYNFLWFGLSPGGMHCDVFDNVLVQLSGRKVVLIYDSELREAVDGELFVTKFPLGSPHAEEVLANHKHLKHLPYYKIELTPGTGVTLPAGAYHAPMALTHDSVSASTFMLPYYRHEPRQIERSHLLSLGAHAILGAATTAHRLLGLKICRIGPYEYF